MLARPRSLPFLTFRVQGWALPSFYGFMDLPEYGFARWGTTRVNGVSSVLPRHGPIALWTFLKSLFHFRFDFITFALRASVF
jgi:hypothetical protein